MKSSISHLPEEKQQELHSITDALVQLVHPEMIILFGIYSRGDWVEDTYKENGTTVEYKSDYDLLVVTAKPQDTSHGLSKEVPRKIKRAGHLQATPNIIFHDIKFLNKELKEGHYFFADIVKEGTVLYETGNYHLVTAKELSSAERAAKVKQYFESWYKKVCQNLDIYSVAFEKGYYDKAAFELHQAAENFYKTVILVFSDYKPKTHDLEDLNKQVGYADARFKIVFPNQAEEEKRRFTILVKAYIDSWYKMGYTVDPADLQWLAERVGKQRELTDNICSEKIEQYLK